MGEGPGGDNCRDWEPISWLEEGVGGGNCRREVATVQTDTVLDNWGRETAATCGDRVGVVGLGLVSNSSVVAITREVSSTGTEEEVAEINENVVAVSAVFMLRSDREETELLTDGRQ